MSTDYFAGADTSGFMVPENSGGGVPESPVLPETPPAATTSEGGGPPPSLAVGDYGEYTADQLEQMFGRFADLEEQSKSWGDVRAERQKIESERALMREAIQLHNLAQNPEVRKLLEPFLQAAPESAGRDPENGRFTGKPIGIHQDPRLTDDFIRQAQEDHEFVRHARESFVEAQIDKTWEGIKGQYPDLVDDAFEKKIAGFVVSESERTGKEIEPMDIVMAAGLELARSGKLVELGRKQVIEELKKKPKGTQVVTSQDQAIESGPVPPGKFTWNDFEKLLANAQG